MSRHLILVAICFFISACAGPQLQDSQQIEIQAKQQAQAEEGSIESVFERVRDIQILAQKEDLYFFSPNYMVNAEAAMTKAKAALSSQNSDQAMTEALKAEAFYQRGLEIKPQAKQQLSVAFSGLNMLRELGSAQRLPSDFKDIENDIRDAIGLIEQDKISDAAEEQKSILQDIRELEIETLSLMYLNPVETALEKAEESDAEEFAERSYRQAEKAMERLDTTISSQPKQRDTIKSNSEKAIRLAQHAKHVAEAAKPLLQLDPQSAEQHILSIERFLSRIGKALGEKDVTHLPLDSQSIALTQTAEILAKQAKSKLEQQLQQNHTQQQNQQLKQRIEELERLLKQSREEDEAVEPTQTTISESPQQDSVQTDGSAALANPSASDHSQAQTSEPQMRNSATKAKSEQNTE